MQPQPQTVPAAEVHEPTTITDWAEKILRTASTDQKAQLTLRAASLWQSQSVKEIGSSATAPERPARPDHVEILPPHKMPARGKAGTLASRQAMLHSLVHIESMAIDLSWDIIARFHKENLPKEFYDDFVKVAADEAKHYSLLQQRLKELNSFYGALPAHDGLWESASQTANNIMARLCIEHMVHEARGLDVTPKTIARFRSAGDAVSADLLESILQDEITHVTAGMRWFTFLCERSDPPMDKIQTFHSIVRENFRGTLKPPFNQSARGTAGMTEEWYMPLVTK